MNRALLIRPEFHISNSCSILNLGDYICLKNSFGTFKIFKLLFLYFCITPLFDINSLNKPNLPYFGNANISFISHNPAIQIELY